MDGNFFKILEFFKSQKSLKEFELVLKGNSAKKSLKRFFEESCLEGALALMLGFAVLLELEAGEEWFFLLPILSFLLPLSFNYFFQILKFEKRKREIEEQVPDALLQAASMPYSSGFANIAEYLARQRLGALSKEFEKASLEIEKGATVREALENIAKRCNSRIVERMCTLLSQGFEAGISMSLVFRETAEDLIETRTILRERSAVLAVQKLTLLFAGALLVPLVLGLLAGMVNDFDFQSFGELGVGLGEKERLGLMQAAQFSNQVYIIEYAIIASLFAAFIDSDLKKSIIYVLALLPASSIAYFIASAL
ncbi:MAG: type II secretion system F family protein [Candidatus Diapherotrites archaeon]|uniref:Type II secretion system F family protein n=2 Tax=Candidatus Iainarchaeum sp. TaxID=3101447 RepID=A0A8T4L4P1_9ARCH|nr:type II secretion system F family protein [Candidatus Diapherotrites archaeon]